MSRELTEKKKSERILSFDLFRGYFLCVILFNHLQYYPSGLDILTGRGFLYASTAEGFFAVSGIVLGIVRGRKLINQPFKVSATLLWKRALQLYLTSIILTFFFTLVGQFFLANAGLKYGIFTDWTHWWDLLWQTITLTYTYGWADFLRYYAVFLFFAPLALWLLRKGLWYVMLAISISVWALYPILPVPASFTQLLSWQFIFFAGLMIGFYWQPLVEKWRKLSRALRITLRTSLATIFIVTLAASFLMVFGYLIGGSFGNWLTEMHHLYEQNFDKERLPIPRLIIGVIWFWGLFVICRRFEKPIRRAIGWLLLPFGTNSLYVYTIQAFIVFFAHLILPPGGSDSVPLNLFISLGLLGVIYLATRTHFLMKIIPR